MTDGDRRRVPADRREAVWRQAAELLAPGGQHEAERVRAVVVALLDARRRGAAEALTHLAERLDRSAHKSVEARLLRALADGYTQGWVEAGDYYLDEPPS